MPFLATVDWRSPYLRLEMASAIRWSQLEQFELANLKSWNMRNPFSFWQQWSEKAAHVGHSRTWLPPLDAHAPPGPDPVEPDPPEAPDEREFGELEPSRFPTDPAPDPGWGWSGPSLNICRRRVCCMKANWSAALRTLDVTTTSMPLLPLELAGGGDPGAPFLFLGMVDSPLRQPTGILALFSVTARS